MFIVNNKHINNLYTVLLVCMPLFNIYTSGFAGLGLGDLFLLLFCIFIIIREKTLKLDKVGYWLFLVYLVLISLILTAIISEFSIINIFIKFAKMILYALVIFCLSREHINLKMGINLYVNLSFIASIYLLLQALVHIFTRIYLPITIPFLKLASMSSGDEYNGKMISGYEVFGYRYSGFFAEPATFSQYTIFAVAFLLFQEEKSIKMNKTIKLIIICLAIIASFSAIGFILLGVVFLYWFLKRSQSKSSLIRKFGLLFVVGVVLGLFVYKTGALTNIYNRLFEVSNINVSSGSIRVLRGFEIYNEFPLVYKFIGIGGGNFDAFILKYNIVTRFDGVIPRTTEYMSGISTVIIYGGIIGLILFSIPMIKLFIYKSNLTRIMLMLLFVILFSASSLISATFVTIMAFIYVLEYRESLIDY